ncbi:MAG: hypothetical protein KDJ14_10915 [Xanthomonadales bacterium]|nr:hypothetical protein [Xanthomonadales bacterium]
MKQAANRQAAVVGSRRPFHQIPITTWGEHPANSSCGTTDNLQASGHRHRGNDRCTINSKPEHIGAWINPDPAKLDALYALFDDKAKPYHEHRLAA